ncbi:pentatricopeptide repeat-containing protein At4g30825, chloroplastic [Telopea speciosissima]|uniref:pentatricopeptide repeat-containing protein At4g30825, chloroplastic n=1 Tax=Telopea speciosissima TaxID=54955 RepID=UPI001CC60232|nr:pentatricopeptide repeat-containing protein At4g30825, chloroplastic [Telopea speciosissima]
MASLKFSTVTEFYEPRKSNLSGKVETFWVSCFTGWVQISRGALNANPFRRLDHIRVSRLATELVDEPESNPVDSHSLKSLEESNPELKSIPRREGRKIGRNLWKRFRDSKGEVAMNSGSRVKEQEEKPSFGCDGEDKESVSTSCVDNDLVIAMPAVTPFASVERCNSILKRLERISDIKALTFFDWMRKNGKLKENLTAYNLILRVLGRKRDWDGAHELIKEMTIVSDCKLNFQVFNTLIYACYKKGLADMGSKWFHLMLENEVKPNIATFGMVMSLCQKSGNLEEAEFIFAQMRSFKLHCQSAYSAMITIYTRLSLYDKSEEVIGFMKEDGVLLNLENWLVLLNAYSQQGKLKEAECILMSMQEAGISLNIVAYNTLITGYGRASDMDVAQNLYQNLQNVGLKPDETTYRSMIEGWGRVDNYSEARWYYKELKRAGFGPNSSNLYTMINLQAKHRDEEGAVETLEDMRKMGCQYSSILSSLLQAYEKAGKVDQVPRILKGMFYEHVLVDQTSCSILVMAYVKHCLVDDALHVLRDKQWEDRIFEENLYHLLICSCKEMGRHENAVKIFTRMPKLDDRPNLHITCTMIDIYGVMGLFTEAIDLYLKLESSGIALDMIAYGVAIRLYVKAGSLNDACSVLDAMEKQKDIMPDTFLFMDILRIYQRCGMLEKLSETYYRILKSGVSWDQEMYNCVINCCAHALPLDEISRLFDEMLHRGFAPNTITFNVMLDVYGKSRLFKKARKVFLIAKKRGLVDVISYNTIIGAYGQSKDIKNMMSSVLKMQFNGFSVSLEAYNCMLDAYGKDGQIEKFKDVLLRMKESKCASDHYTYNIMINIYGEQGWIDDVAGVLTELKECGLEPDLCSYNTLIKAYGIAGMVEEAVAVVKEMRENGIKPDQKTYLNLISALWRNDNFLEAVKWSLWMKQMGMSS